MAGKNKERQERRFIELKRFLPKNICFRNRIIHDVINVEKCMNSTVTGNEPYPDVVIHTTTNVYNISMKDERSAPSLAGGGFAGIRCMDENMPKEILAKIRTFILDKLNKKTGDSIPDIYVKISNDDKIKLLRGCDEIGGEIDYMFIGAMNFNYDVSDHLTIDASLFTINEFAVDNELYFRMRKRAKNQTFDSEAKYETGEWRIYNKVFRKNSKGKLVSENQGRIVVVNKLPKNGVLIHE